MAIKTSSLLVRLETVKSDPSFKEGGRGARKILVTELYEEKEIEAFETVWNPPSKSDKCQVQIMEDSEVAVFNQNATQDKHYHKIGTEIYLVVEGNMIIEVEDEEFQLQAGDMIVVNPNSVHKVKSEKCDFICSVISIDCQGKSDKYIVES